MSALMVGQSPLIVVVEDEDHIAEAVLFNLTAEGYRTHHEVDGEAALAWLMEAGDAPAAVLLDVMLPSRDGFSIVRALRDAGRFTPVLLLTARGRVEDVVEGFEAGADDYLAKPFELDVLLARLAAMLRRVRWQAASPAAALARVTSGETAEVVTLGARSSDFEALEVRTGGDVVHLTVMEADLLRYLIDRAGKIVARKEILENVWRVREDTDTRAIDNFIVRLRRYIEVDPSVPVHLLTVRGVGYRFVLPAQSE